MSFLSQFSAPTTTVVHTHILLWPFSLEKFLVRTQAWVVTRKWWMRHTPFLLPFHASLRARRPQSTLQNITRLLQLSPTLPRGPYLSCLTSQVSTRVSCSLLFLLRLTLYLTSIHPSVLVPHHPPIPTPSPLCTHLFSPLFDRYSPSLFIRTCTAPLGSPMGPPSSTNYHTSIRSAIPTHQLLPEYPCHISPDVV